jgi:ActR/RegA family two-component response regulator
MDKARLLFVDDEDSIRITLPAILSQEGFDVTTAATVAEAIALINRQSFDILLSDLNIGQPGDGFTVVSAMRRIQPKARTFILTGYPDFSSALEAIRRQVDDYLTKPADIPTLVRTLKSKLQREAPQIQGSKKTAVVLRENEGELIDLWFQEVQSDPRFQEIPMSQKERIDHLPGLLKELARRIEKGALAADPESSRSAALHGRKRREQGYSATLIVQECRVFYRVIANRLQQNLLDLDISTVIPDLIRISDILNEMLQESIREFHHPEGVAA